MKKSIILLAILSLFSCKTMNMASTHSGVKPQTKEVIVASYKSDCVGVAPQTCYLYKENQADDWKFFYGEVNGFDYEPGYEYVLEVSIKADGNNYQDASNYDFELVNVISKTQDKEGLSALNDSWGLLELNGVAVNTASLTRSPMIDISTIRKQFQGSTGCNSFSTSFTYNAESGAFKVAFPIPMPQMACPGYDIQSEFLTALESVDSFKIDGVDLLLSSKGKVVLKYRKVD